MFAFVAIVVFPAIYNVPICVGLPIEALPLECITKLPPPAVTLLENVAAPVALINNLVA